MLARLLTPAVLLLLASPASADTPKEYKELEAMAVKALEAYNKDDVKGAFADYVEGTVSDAKFYFDRLFKAPKASLGKYKKHTFDKSLSIYAGTAAALSLNGEFEKGKGRIGVNFLQVDGKWKIQAMMIEPK